jgi:hypothetical protein
MASGSGAIRAALLLLGLMACDVAETAVIRMVNETEETGRRRGLHQGLRTGWPPRAGRLFLIDPAAGLLAALAFVAILGLAAAPVILVLRGREAAIIMAGLRAVGVLIQGGGL